MQSSSASAIIRKLHKDLCFRILTFERMNMKVFSKYSLFVALGAMIFASCGRNNQSRATGWSINSKKEDFSITLNSQIKKQDLVLFLLKVEHLQKGKYKTMLCTIGTIRQHASM